MEYNVIFYYGADQYQRRWRVGEGGAPPLKTTSTPHVGTVAPPSLPQAVPA